MPGLTINTSQPTITVYRSAHELPSSVWDALKEYETSSNTFYPHALHSLRVSPDPREAYIVLRTGREVEFVLALTEGQFGAYPIFIVPTVPHGKLFIDAFLLPRANLLANALADLVPASRTFSVFAPERLCEAFSNAWTKRTSVPQLREPYYAAMQTWCDRTTLKPDSPVVARGDRTVITPRLATMSDLDGVAQCCYEFAEDSPPFVLTHDEARLQAKKLIVKQEVWVLDVLHPDGTSSVGSIVAASRNTKALATINKVYTPVVHRRKGYAQRLVRHASRDLLYRQNKQCIVLYVAHNNPSATKVYHNVGFVGLRNTESRVGVEPWLEIGFNQNKVKLGHW